LSSQWKLGRVEGGITVLRPGGARLHNTVHRARVRACVRAMVHGLRVMWERERECCLSIVSE
jgi:hypothetical protein